MATVANVDRARLTPYEKRLNALRKGNVARIEAAELKRELARGRITFVRALADPRSDVIEALALVRALPSWGRERSGDALRTLRIDPAVRCGELGRDDRRRLALYVTIRMQIRGAIRRKSGRLDQLAVSLVEQVDELAEAFGT